MLYKNRLKNAGKGRDKTEAWALPEAYAEELSRFKMSLLNRSERSKLIYENGVKHLLAFLAQRWGAPDVEALTREHAETWVAFLVEESGYAPTTIGSMVTSASLFAKRLVELDVLDENPFQHVKGMLPRETLKEVAILQPEEIQAILDAAKKDKTIWGKRDAALVAALFWGGFRRQELLAIEERDIDWGYGRITIRRGKGGASRQVGLDPRALLLIERYLRARAAYLRALPKHRRDLLKDGPIWLSQKGATLEPMGLAAALVRLAKRAGVEKKVNPHAFRHSAATLDVSGGMGEMSLRMKFGWSPSSTMPYRYTRSNLSERAAEASQTVRSGDGIKI